MILKCPLSDGKEFAIFRIGFDLLVPNLSVKMQEPVPKCIQFGGLSSLI